MSIIIKLPVANQILGWHPGWPIRCQGCPVPPRTPLWLRYCGSPCLSGESCGGSDPHYQVFVELKGLRNLTEEQRYKLDQCLQDGSAIYKSFRFRGSIGPMRVQMVSEGAFQELRTKMMAFSDTSANTFKMQRVLRRKEYADFLLGKTIS